MKKKFDFVVLAADGLQGRIAARDLLENGYSVLLCGKSDKELNRIRHLFSNYKRVGFKCVDARDIPRMTRAIRKSRADVVVNCVEGDWDLNVLKACVDVGVHSLDLGSEIEMTKTQLDMDEQLKKDNIISVTGCGSVPGIGNIMLNYAAQKLDRIDTIEMGFSWTSNIKKFVVPFSIESITEEFLEPAPVLENGKFKYKTPLKTVRNCYHKTIGRQKEFIVRHPETYTLWRYFKDKGVKNIRFYCGFPFHSFDRIMAMIELGLANQIEIDFNKEKVRPVEFLTEVLRDLEIPEGYIERENIWVKVTGIKNCRRKKILMECLASTIPGWESAGCNIDTGFPASIIAQMIKKGVIHSRGSFAPEAVVPPKPFFEELRKKGMPVLENGKIINGAVMR